MHKLEVINFSIKFGEGNEYVLCTFCLKPSLVSIEIVEIYYYNCRNYLKPFVS